MKKLQKTEVQGIYGHRLPRIRTKCVAKYKQKIETNESNYPQGTRKSGSI